MSNVGIQTDGLRKVEVPAAKLWGAAQTQRSLRALLQEDHRICLPFAVPVVSRRPALSE